MKTEKKLMSDRARILLVDDEENLLELLSEVLTDEGYEVTTATSAEEALGKFEKDPFPLVITDILMGGLDGIELLQIIKEHYEQTQVLIITSHASTDSALAAQQSGAYDYLIKPFDDLNLVTAAVEQAFQNLPR